MQVLPKQKYESDLAALGIFPMFHLHQRSFVNLKERKEMYKHFFFVSFEGKNYTHNVATSLHCNSATQDTFS